MSFELLNLDQNISKALIACGYTTPTPIQAQSIPDILLGKDLVASAQTGTGKTAAFVLPALHRLATQEPSKKTRILILTPTRELASQITKAASNYGKYLRYNIVSLVGGMPYQGQIRDLARGADIIVATPGRLMDHMEQKRVDLSSIEMLVLDEADRMLDMGFIEDVEYIAKLTPSNRQTLLFSATVDKQLTTVVRHLLKNPVRIDLSEKTVAAPQIKQEMYKVTSPQNKLALLKQFLHDENIFKAIIFTATKISADRVAERLREEGFATAALHGDLRQNVRNRTVEALRRGKIQYLVATDVAARGIDISDVTHVFNFDLPRTSEDYVHRIGRTGRAGKTGIAISFVMPSETRQLSHIERYTGLRLQLIQNVDIKKRPVQTQENADGTMEILSLKKPYVLDLNGDRPHHKKKFSSDGDRQPRSEGRYRGRSVSDEPRSEGGYRDKSSEGRHNERGYRSRASEGGFRKERSEGGFRGRSSEGSRNDRPARSEGGFRSRSSEGNRSEGGYRGRSSEGSRSDRPTRSEGGYRGRSSEGNRSEGGFRGRSSEGNRSEGGYRGRSSEGSRGDRPARSSEGGYRGRSSEGNRSEGGYRGRSSEGSRGDRPARSSEGGGYRNRSSEGSRGDRPAFKTGDRPFKKRAPKKDRHFSD